MAERAAQVEELGAEAGERGGEGGAVGGEVAVAAALVVVAAAQLAVLEGRRGRGAPLRRHRRNSPAARRLAAAAPALVFGARSEFRVQEVGDGGYWNFNFGKFRAVWNKRKFSVQKKLFFTLFFYIGVYITPAHMYFFFQFDIV